MKNKLVEIDKNDFIYCGINTENLLKQTTEPLSSELESKLNLNGWICENIEHLEDVFGEDYECSEIQNVYNYEQDFMQVFQFSIIKPKGVLEWYYSDDDIYIAYELHQGGDVRGNYGAVEIRKFIDSDNAYSFMLADTLTWELWNEQKQELHTDYELVEQGYSSSPSSELEKLLDDTEAVTFCEKVERYYGTIKGEKVSFRPFVYINGAYEI